MNDGRRTFMTRALLAGLAVCMSTACSAVRGSSRVRQIPLSALQRTAIGVRHPETVIGSRDGRMYVSNADSPCAVVELDGTVRHVGKTISPNGIAMDTHSRIVIANFGLGKGVHAPLQRLDLASGSVETLADSVNGRALVACNFPVLASDGSIYCTHTSWGPGLDDCIDPTAAAGFVIRIDPAGRVSVARDGLTTPNGCCFDADERYLYVAQTAGGNIVRMRRTADGSLGDPEPYGPRLGATPANTTIRQIQEEMLPEQRAGMGHPDGIGFDVDGNLWVTLVFANKVVAMTPSREVVTVIDDAAGDLVIMPTGLAWGGPSLTELYIACAGRDYILRTKSPVAGIPLPHQRQAGRSADR